ncbi:hypothetical protein VE02_01440 [Pseudogymnoascus sp. 03VT05]|nr:hypothetical protein VE02_01440 [Pseudogymnoascus sp. 03VT05]
MDSEMRGLDIDAISKAFEAEPSNYEVAWKDLRDLVEKMDVVDDVPTLSTESLGTYEALELFDLCTTKDYLYPDEQGLPIPSYLKDNIDRVRSVTNNGAGGNNNAFFRTVLDQLLITSIYEESNKQMTEVQDQDPNLTSHHLHRSAYQPRILENPAKLELLRETPLSMIVTHGGERKLLSGFADYALFYGGSDLTLATNLVIVEAKRRFGTDSTLPQLAAYMGIVHTTRKNGPGKNCVVYGMSSDGNSFRFCRINNDGMFSNTRLLEWEIEADRGRIYSILRSIIREAAMLSPSTVPIKDPIQRKLALAAFGRPNPPSMLKSAIGSLKIYDLEEVEEGVYEIVDGE